MVPADGFVNDLHLFLLFGQDIVPIAHHGEWRTLKEQFFSSLDNLSIDYLLDSLDKEIPLMASPFQIHRFHPPKSLRLSPKSQHIHKIRQFSLAHPLMYWLRCAVFAPRIDAALEGGG